MKTFRITGNGKAAGQTFEVEDDATEDEIAEEAWEIVVQYGECGYEEVKAIRNLKK
jgi:hypothetical protein